MNQAIRATVGILAMTTALSACSTKARTGAVIGAAGGGAVGAVIGKQVGSTAKGAIIGAAVGGTAGAIIGSRMDKQAQELAMEIQGAQVQRVGEGIVVTFDSGLLFAYDSDAIQGTARSNLTNLAASVNKHDKTDVLIVGHTDAMGSESYNQGLSERRSASAANYLIAQGVERGRIRTAGRGELEPIDTNDTSEGRAQNRRVEVVIVASEQMKREVASR